jgi:hypothetical protein
VQHPDADLAELTAAERQLFAILRTDQWGPRVRLEQERLAWPEALATLRAALEEAGSAFVARQDFPRPLPSCLSPSSS